VQQVIVRTLMAGSKVVINDKHSFELYGYDILFDDNLKVSPPLWFLCANNVADIVCMYQVWLVEVNACPSMSTNTDSDYQMKWGLLHDTLNVVDMENRCVHVQPIRDRCS